MFIEDQRGALASLLSSGTQVDGALSVAAEGKGALESLTLAVKCSGLEMHATLMLTFYWPKEVRWPCLTSRA